jgi:hypothetical protein
MFFDRYSKNSHTFANEFISHLRKGNRETQASDAMRFLLFIPHRIIFFYIFSSFYLWLYLYLADNMP